MLILLLCLPLLGFSQKPTFSYADSNFKIESILTLETLSFVYWKRPQKQDSLILNGIKDFLLSHPKIKIEIGVFTDYRGSEKYNLETSKREAEYIKYWLINVGINTTQLTSVGYGEQYLIHTEENINQMVLQEEKEKGHKANNRIEIKIIEILE